MFIDSDHEYCSGSQDPRDNHINTKLYEDKEIVVESSKGKARATMHNEDKQVVGESSKGKGKDISNDEKIFDLIKSYSSNDIEESDDVNRTAFYDTSSSSGTNTMLKIEDLVKFRRDIEDNKSLTNDLKAQILPKVTKIIQEINNNDNTNDNPDLTNIINKEKQCTKILECITESDKLTKKEKFDIINRLKPILDHSEKDKKEPIINSQSFNNVADNAVRRRDIAKSASAIEMSGGSENLLDSPPAPDRNKKNSFLDKTKDIAKSLFKK
jgi:predicted DNA-binding protein YlxM (UPF0122 family)